MHKRSEELRAQEERAKHEREMHFVLHPLLWLHWPVLPMKERNPQPGAMPRVGFIYADGKARVYLENLCRVAERAEHTGSLPDGSRTSSLTWSMVLKDLAFEEHASFNELLKRWEID